MGSRGHAIQLRSRVQNTATSFQGYSLDPLYVIRKGRMLFSRSDQSQDGFYSMFFLVPRKGRNIEASNQPSTSKSVYWVSQLQNGNVEGSHTLSETGGLNGIHRYQRCLSTHPHLTLLLEVPAFRI